MCFGGLLGDDLCEVLKSGLEDQELAYSQYLAAIILLYKKGARANIKNWRPISLLNTDYKLLSKVLAERLKTVLPQIINSDQKGCVKGRYIGENIRMIDDILYEIENNGLDSVILQLDQEKAFDRVEWEWLYKTLESFNFGEKFIGYLKTMYKQAKSCIITNGYQSAYFDITRGIRQGDSLSALLFIIQFEPLMEKVRNVDSITGVSLKLKNSKKEFVSKGCQYVDDSNTILKNPEAISNFFKVVNKYEKVSGSKVNIDKTVCIALKKGIFMNNDSSWIKDMTITSGPQKVLGVPVGLTKNNYADFWDKLVDKLKTKLDIWRLRPLSFQGKVLLIKSMALSQVMYAIEMKCIDPAYVDRINAIIFEFLWSGKKYRIKREFCFLPKELGGLGVPSVDILVKVKRIQWIIRFLKSDIEQNWSQLIENYLRCLDNMFAIDYFCLKVTDSSDLISSANIPYFYKECINSFQELLRIGSIRESNEIIWSNDRYKFDNKTLNFKHWSKCNIKTMSDLYHEGSLQEAYLLQKLSFKAGFFFESHIIKKVFHRNSVITNDENSWVSKTKECILEYRFNVPGVGIKLLSELTSKDLYTILLQNKITSIPTKEYWENKLQTENINFDNWIQTNINNKFMPRNCCDFNWKILHKLVNTEVILQKMQYSDGKCKVCDSNIPENIDHLIYECSTVKPLWNLIAAICSDWLGEPFAITKNLSLSGEWQNTPTENSIILNVIISITRFHIWKIRNLIKYGEEKVSPISNIKRLKWSLGQHFFLLVNDPKTPKSIFELATKIKYIIDGQNVLLYMSH